MAKAPAHSPTFSRGSTVLDYWLVHAEGMTVQPIGARVEEVVVTARVGHAEALIVRSRVTGRRTSIPASAIAAVEPSSGELLLDPTARASRTGAIVAWVGPHAAHLGRTSAQAGRIGAARTSQGAAWCGSRTRAGFVWLRPHAARLGRAGVRAGRTGVARTSQGAKWLAPRARVVARTSAAAAMRWTLAAAVLTARGVARAGRGIGDAAAATAERARESLDARRAR
jgi:hypothetical protein